MINSNFGRGKCLKGTKPNDVVLTPIPIARKIISKFDLVGKTILDPFKGKGAFYDNFPIGCNKEWCEITEGKDFFDYSSHVDWIISNPPYSIYDEVIKHSFEISDNVVYLVPLSKIVSSMGRVREVKNYGGVPYVWILGAGKCGFPFGFPACAIHFQRGYSGDTRIEID